MSEPVVNKEGRERGGIIPSSVVKANDAARQESRDVTAGAGFKRAEQVVCGTLSLNCLQQEKSEDTEVTWRCQGLELVADEF